VAEVGRTHHAPCPPRDRKVLVVEQTSRALARRKLEASPDGGHERRDGEMVRGIAFTIKSTRWFGPWASQKWESSQVLDTTEDVLGLLPVPPSPAVRSRVLRLAGQFTPHHPQGACDGQRIGRHRGWSGVPTSDSESIRWSARSGEGSTRSEKVQGEFASSALKRRRRAVRRRVFARS